LLSIPNLNVNLQNRKDETPLFIAAEKDQVAIVKALLSAGASPHIMDNQGRSAMDVASSAEVESALSEMARLLKYSTLGTSAGRDSPLSKSIPMQKQYSTGNIGYNSVSTGMRSTATPSPPLSPIFSRTMSHYASDMASSSSSLSSSAPNGIPYMSRERSGSISNFSSFAQASHRLILMDEELHHSSTTPDSMDDSPLLTENMQFMVERLGSELVDELGHLLSDAFILDALQKITSSKSFRWRSSFSRTKIEVLKWMADFVAVDSEEQQDYLRYLKTKYAEAIKLTFVRTTSAKKLSKKEKSQKRLTMVDRKIKAYEWELLPDQIQLGEIIGTGSFGSVYHATLIPGGEDVAVKQLVDDVGEDDSATFMKEIAILSRLDHPAVVGFVGASISGALALVMEYCSAGNLKMFLQQHKPSWKYKCKLARQAAEGIAYLHAQSPPIVHRDLKCQNILVNDEGKAKVSDFGLSKTISRTIGNASRMGTLNWLAPEVLRGDVHHSTAVDVYAFGMVLYEILMDGTPPYESWAPLQIVRAIDEGLKPEIPSTCDQRFRSLMEACWHPESVKRPGFEEICLQLRTIERVARQATSTSSSSDSNSPSPPITPRSGSATLIQTSTKKKSGAESPSKTSPCASPLSETRASSLKLRPKTKSEHS
jgi:serine/threonine protein kinase